jgi:hypothetical protein
MRKRTIIQDGHEGSGPGGQWLELERLARVEVTSEATAHPIEGALLPDGDAVGWRAAGPGAQVLRVVFDEPQRLRRIHMEFEEHAAARTQEFLLRWSTGAGAPFRELLRQQYTFSPPGTYREVEDYAVDLDAVRALEIHIRPDVTGGGACATLGALRLA